MTESIHDIRKRESAHFLSRLATDVELFTPNLRSRCTECILSDAVAKFSENGICEFCQNYTHLQQEQDKNQLLIAELDSLLRSSSQSGLGTYDALLLYSGGKDSAYLLSELTQRYPELRILALLIDNGFASQVAFENTRFAFEKFDITHFVFTPKKSLYQKLFRHCVMNFHSRGGYETVDRADGDLLFDIAKNLAVQLHIPLVLAGLSKAQCEDILNLNRFEISPESLKFKRSEIAGFALSEIYEKADYRYWWDGTAVPENLLPRIVFPFFCWEYDEAKIRNQVVERGLIPPGESDPIITNHRLIPLILALDYLRLGYCTFEPEFAKLVRSGKSPRELWLPFFQALEHLVPKGEFMPQSIARVLVDLELDPKALGIPLNL
ncbi:MAG: hypothetical protein KDD60_01915 [Bdellovibrionales bacterium]|nr:hypothetical protein [Bdellovibrionales bacterium]